MALPKVLTRIEEKLDRVLEMLEQQPAPPPQEAPALNPDAFAQSIDYDTHNAKEVIERVASLSAEQRAALLIYEQGHANRKTVLEALAS